MAVSRWIDGDESGAEMIARVLKERISLFVPPLHRVPLRVGNVVELVGPSGSAKTQILIQAAVNCILPKEWNGVHYGGLERLVVFIDLDCRLDISRLYQVLKLRILEANGNGFVTSLDYYSVLVSSSVIHLIWRAGLMMDFSWFSIGWPCDLSLSASGFFILVFTHLV